MNQKSPSPGTTSARRLGSLEAAARQLDCSPRTVRRLIAEGELSAYRVGKRLIRVDLDEVDQLPQSIPSAAS